MAAIAMTANSLTLLLMAALLVAAAIFHSPWWLAGLAPLAAWAGFDRWARHGGTDRFVNPVTGRELAETDLGRVRLKAYAIGDFFTATTQGERACLIGTCDDLRAMAAACADTAKGLPALDPRRASVFAGLACTCASCGQELDDLLGQRILADMTGRGAPSTPVAEARPLPDARGHCPRCGGDRFRYVHDP